jgi:GT2 family glycosyltransferase
MEKEKNIGASICKLIDENNNIQKTVMRLKYNLLSILINHFFLHKIPIINRLYKKHYYYEPYYTKIQFPQTISGAFMFIRKKIYDNIGGFDEKYFMYSEDNDLSIRINKISKIIYYPKVITIHIGATTFGKAKSIENLKIFYKSLFYFIEKFYGKKKLFLMKIAFKINAIVLFPFVYAISNQNLKFTLINRNKLFLKMPLRGTDV